MRIGAALSLALALLALSAPASAQPRGPSYDCAKARAPIEKLVCAEPKLAALDRVLAAAWGAIPHDAKLVAEQRAWLETMRRECGPAAAGGDADAANACIGGAYRARVVALGRPRTPAGLVAAAAAACREVADTLYGDGPKPVDDTEIAQVEGSFPSDVASLPGVVRWQAEIADLLQEAGAPWVGDLDGDGKLDVAKSRHFTRAEINTLTHTKEDVVVPGFVIFDAEDGDNARLIWFALNNEDANATNQTGGLTYLAGRRWLVSRPDDASGGKPVTIRWVDPEGIRDACMLRPEAGAAPRSGPSCAAPACVEAASLVAELRKQDEPGIDFPADQASLPVEQIKSAIKASDDWSDGLNDPGGDGPLLSIFDADNDGSPDLLELRTTMLWGGKTSESEWRIWQWRQGKLAPSDHPMEAQINALPGGAAYDSAGLGTIGRPLIHRGKAYWYFAGTQSQAKPPMSRTETIWVFLGHPSGLKPVGTIERTSTIRDVTILPGKDLPKLR